jgi:hypothetical protein
MHCKALLVIALSLVFVGLLATFATEQAEPSAPRAASEQHALPTDARASISAAIGRDQATYHAAPANAGYRAENRAHNLTATFREQGVEVSHNSTRWGLALRAWGRGDELQSVVASAPHTRANRVEYPRGTLTEWYVNGPFGLEQGFTLDAPPGKSNDEPLTLALTLTASRQATVDQDGLGLALVNDAGATAMHYRGLSAYDVTGRELRAWMEMGDHTGSPLRVRVDDAGAQYPITIDPWIQQAKLTSSDWVAGDYFGQSVAISGDTVVVGAYGDDSNRGAAYVFVKPTGGWSSMSQIAKLTASDGQAGVLFGSSVAINGDTVVVGAWFANASFNNQGAAYVFVKPAGGWANMTQTAKLTTGSDGFMYDNFGASVAINSNTIVVGAPFYNATNVDQGAAFVFVKPPGGWATTSTYTARLTASDGATSDRLGKSVAISGDTIVAGAWGDDSQRGSAYVFVKPPGGWKTTSTYAAKLIASDGAANDYFGGLRRIVGLGYVA